MSTRQPSSRRYLSQFTDGKRYEDVSMLSKTANATEDTPTTEGPFDLDATFRAHYARITRVIAWVVNDPARAEELAVKCSCGSGGNQRRKEARPRADRTARQCIKGSTSCGG